MTAEEARLGGRLSGVEAVTFDATGTLFHAPRLGEIYSEVLARHGIEVVPAAVREAIRDTWVEFDGILPAGVDRFGSEPGGSRGWWRRFLERVCARLEAPPPSRFAAAEMYDRFRRGDAWEVYPDALEAVGRLRRFDLPLAVISNWDERLPDVLEGLGLRRHFVTIVASSAIGVEKPDARIFQRALAGLGVEASMAMHIGDRRIHDYEGATAAGMRALWLDRSGEAGDLTLLTELFDE